MIRMPKAAKKNPLELTVVRVTPTKWTASLGPREAYFVFRGSRLVDVVQERSEDIAAMLAKGYPQNADLEVEVRPAEYRKLLAQDPPGSHRNPGGCPTWAIQAFVNDKLDEGWTVPVRGGLADALPARRFRLNSLVQGTCVELEHTTDWETALGIAMDHLTEAQDYYVRLATIEPQHNPAKIEYRMARALNPFRPPRTQASSGRLRNLARRLGRGEC